MAIHNEVGAYSDKMLQKCLKYWNENNLVNQNINLSIYKKFQ